MNRLTYNGRGYYTGLTSEGTRLYVAVERMRESAMFALENQIDLNLILDPDSWIYMLPRKAAPTFKREMIQRIWGKGDEDHTGSTERMEGVFLGEEDAGLGLFELLTITNDAIMDTPEHRFILHVKYIARRPAIAIEVYTALGQLVKEHKYSSWPVMYAGLCSVYDDFQIHHDWLIYIPKNDKRPN